MPDEKEPIPKFAARIKAKYPQYKDMNDTLLVEKIINKYPEYKDLVDFDGGVKKKEPIGVPSKIGGEAGSFAPPSGEPITIQSYEPTLKTKLQEQIETNKAAQRRAVGEYAYSLKTPEQKQYAKETPEIAAAKSYREGDTRLMEIVSTGETDPVSAAKKQASSKTDVQDILKDFMAVKSFTDLTGGYDAKQLLAANKATGETAEILKAKERNYDATVQPFREIQFMYGDQIADKPENDYNYKEKIYSAALQAYANKNPLFAAQVKAAGIDPKDWTTIRGKFDSGTLGHKMYEVLNDPEFAEYVEKENSALYDAVQKVSDDLLTDNPDYGINTVANEISRERQKVGFNNPIVEFDDRNFKRETDLVAEKLYRDDPVKMKIYQDYIQQDPDKYIDTPSLFEGMAGGAKGVYRGIGNTFTEPFRSVPESIKRSWEKESSYVSADPKGITRFMDDTGHVLGLVGAIGGLGNVMGGGGVGFYSTKAVPALSGGVLPFMGDMLEEGRKKYPTSPVKAWTSALTNTAMYAALSQQLFPAEKVRQALSDVKPQVTKIVDRLTAGEITREAAKRDANTAFKKAYDFLAGTTKGSAKIAGELSAITAFNRGLDRIMMDEQSFEQFHPEGEVTDTFKSMFLSNLVLAGFAKYGQQKRENRLAKETYYELASNPKMYERLINNSAVDKSFGTTNEMRENLAYISKLKEQLSAQGITPEAQKEYIYQALREKAANDLAATSEDATIKKQQTEISKEAAEVKQDIIDGKFKEPEPFVDEAMVDQDRDLMDEGEQFNEKEQAAIDGLKGKDFSNSIIKPYTDIIQNENLPISERKQALKELSDQLTAKGTEITVGEALGSKADLIYDLGYPIAEESAGLQGILSGETHPESGISVQMPQEVTKPQTTEIKPAEAAPQEPQAQPQAPNNEELNSVNPSGSLFSDYTPEQRMAAPLGKNMVTLDKTTGGTPEDIITIYRGGEGDKIVGGDYVTTNKQLAKDYAGTGKVIEMQVRKGDIIDDITEPGGEEYIYRPSKIEAASTASTQLQAEPAQADVPPVEPPAGEPPVSAGGEAGMNNPDILRLAHADTERIYEEAGLPLRAETLRKGREQLEKEANEQLEKGYDFDKVAEEVMNGDYNFQDTDQFNFARKVATLKAKQNNLSIDLPEFDSLQKQIEKYSRASDVAGTIGGRLLQSRKTYVPVEESIADAIMTEKDITGVDELTAAQKQIVKEEFDALQKAQNEYAAKIQALQEENAKLKADAEVKKVAKTVKREKKDYKKEREEIFNSIKDKLKASRQDTQAAVIPYLKELVVISPDVAKLVKSYVEQGITELAGLVAKIKEDLQQVDELKNITDKDVRDLIAGEYKEKKPTRNELAAKVVSLKNEAKLVNELDRILSGEIPKEEKKKIQRNQRIKELRDQIKAAKDLEPSKLEVLKNRYRAEIEKIKNQIKSGDFSKPEPPQKIKLDKEALQLRDNIIRLKQQREARRLLIARQNESGRQKGMRYAAEVLNVPRTLMTIGDFSGLLRQNIFFAAGHPLRTAAASKEMFKAAFSQKQYDRWFADLKESDRYPIMEESKLAITDSISHDLSQREEDFMSTLAEKIPIVGRSLKVQGKTVIPGLNIVKGSERSYTALLNKARVDMFNYFADAMEARGLTFENSPKQYKAMAEYINNATGRSDFGKHLNRIAPILNSVFFSPRLIASRVNMLTYFMQPRFWKTLPKEVRIDYMRNWGSLLGIGMTILGLAKMAGADVEDDPRSSDFGKIKSGNTRWDIWGGAQPYVRVVAQLASGKRKSTNSGKLYDLNGDDIFGETRAGVVTDFFRGKLAPVPGAAVDILSGRTTVGDKIVYQMGNEGDNEVSIDRYVKERLLPMTITGVQESIKDQGPMAFLTVGVPSTFGIGTSTYDVKPPKTMKVYNGDDNTIRDATVKEFEDFNKKKEEIAAEILKEYEQSGVMFDRFGELTDDEKEEETKKEYRELTDDQKKKLKSKIASAAAAKAREELGLYSKEQAIKQ